MFTPTEEQQAIIDAARDSAASLMVKAYAGCAKTSSIKMLAPALPTRSVCAVAFNKKIAEELSAVLPPYFTCSTMNSLGHKAFGSAIGRRLVVDGNKIGKLVTDFGKSLGSGGLVDEEWTSLRNLLVRARVVGLIPEGLPESRRSLCDDSPSGWDDIAYSAGVDLTEQLMIWARDLLKKSIALAKGGLIDYDDQIYMSTLFMGLYPKFHTVIVDESQDLSVLNHIQLRKLTSSRLICVGDPKQAIYAFRGADSSSMEKIRALRPEWIDLPLTLTFRCPKKIVQRQLSHAPGFRAAESAPEGEIVDLRHSKAWSIERGSQISAILCRNNAPLIALAFKLIKKRIGVQVLGRDFGKSLVALLKKLCGTEDTLRVEECARRISEWMEKEIALARAQDKDEKIAGITDRGESLLAVCDSGEVKDLSDIKSWLIELFEEQASDKVILSSIHKAKGLEWHTVLHLDSWRLPSKFARLAEDDGNPVPMEQEMNLKYVCETRAKHTLILANLENFQ